MEKPTQYNNDVKEFLNNLRESGKTNMFGATPFIQQKFGFRHKEASDCLLYWMETFEG